MDNKATRPVIIGGKIYVCGENGFRTACSTGVAGSMGSVHQPDGYYVRMQSGVRIHDKEGAPFVFMKREGNSGFIVTCHQTPEGVRYMFGASEVDLQKLGLNCSDPSAHRLERELAERVLWETSPAAQFTVYELRQRADVAEAEYERALDRVYGVKREAETRYWRHTDPSLKSASAAFDAACQAWRSAYRFSQEPAKVSEALTSMTDPAEAQVATRYLVATWASVDTASFEAHGPRDEMSMMLARLSDDIDALEKGSVTHEPIVLVDTNGVAVGEAVFMDAAPDAPVDGRPLLIVPAKDLDRVALAVTDVYTKLQSSIEDVHLLSHIDEVPLAHFYWRDLPALERDWHRAASATRESLQVTHDRVLQQMGMQDRTNANARFIRTYEGIDHAADSLDLQACLMGFGDSARVGYFKDGQWTGIASEITLGGKVLTTLNGRRAKGTGYTADGEWQRDQLETALSRMQLAFEGQPSVDVYAAAADLYAEPGSP